VHKWLLTVIKSELSGWVEDWELTLKVLFLAIPGLCVTANKQNDPFLPRHLVLRSDLPTFISARTPKRLRVRFSPSLTDLQKATV